MEQIKLNQIIYMKNDFIIKPYYGCDDTTIIKTYKVEDVVNGSIIYVGTYKECNDFIDGEYIMGCDPAVEGDDKTVTFTYKGDKFTGYYKIV